MEVMPLREQGRHLTGRVGSRRLPRCEIQGGKAGRGSPNKVEFVAAVQTTESGEAVTAVPVQAALHQGIDQGVRGEVLAAPATLVSDGLGCFTAVRGTGILPRAPRHGGGAVS